MCGRFTLAHPADDIESFYKVELPADFLQRRMTAVMIRAALLTLVMVAPLCAQVDGFSKEQIVKYTPNWTGERLDDGRPKISDALIQRIKKVRMTSEEAAWGPLRLTHNYMHQ